MCSDRETTTTSAMGISGFIHFLLSAYAFYLSWSSNYDKPTIDRFLRACVAYIFAIVYLILHFLLWRPEYLAKMEKEDAYLIRHVSRIEGGGKERHHLYQH